MPMIAANPRTGSPERLRCHSAAALWMAAALMGTASPKLAAGDWPGGRGANRDSCDRR